MHDEIAARNRAIRFGGIGVLHNPARMLRLDKIINYRHVKALRNFL